MRICENVYQIKINFNVTEKIARYVYVYIIKGNEGIYLFDTGTDGSMQQISSYLSENGMSINDVKAIFLTHSHPDHMGAAYDIQQISGCKVYGSEKEADWFENVDKEFSDRPIPNFYSLLNKSVRLTNMITSNQIINIESGITINVIETPGHSAGSVSYIYEEENVVFCGDAIPVGNDIPIYISYIDSIHSLNILENIPKVTMYCPAWGEVWNQEIGKENIEDAKKLLNTIDENVKNIVLENPELSKDEIFKKTCSIMKLQMLSMNPLFRQSVYSHLQ